MNLILKSGYAMKFPEKDMKAKYLTMSADGCLKNSIIVAANVHGLKYIL